MEFKKYVITCTHCDGQFKTYMLEGLEPQEVVKTISHMLRTEFPYQTESGWRFDFREL